MTRGEGGRPPRAGSGSATQFRVGLEQPPVELPGARVTAFCRRAVVAERPAQVDLDPILTRRGANRSVLVGAAEREHGPRRARGRPALEPGERELLVDRAALAERERNAGRRVALVLSGANLDRATLARALDLTLEEETRS